MLIRNLIILLSAFFFSCKNTPIVDKPVVLEENFQNKGHQIIYNTVTKIGDLQSLAFEKKDVIYTRTLHKWGGLSDVSLEKYLFNGELSYGKYYQHEHTLPNLSGTIEQGYNGKTHWIKNNGHIVSDMHSIAEAKANRTSNFYWFVFIQKLLDPGLFYHHIGVTTIDEEHYDIVRITIDPTGLTSTNVYQLYINQETSLIDKLVYDSDDFEAEYRPRLFLLEYESIDGVLIPTKRKYKKSNWNAEISDKPWTYETWSDISFENGLTIEDFNTNH